MKSYVPWSYPQELEADITTATGLMLHLRPIRSDDADKLVEFHAHLSFDSIYRRYFSLHPKLSSEEVQHFTRVDYVDRLALVIEDGETLVGVGRYDRYPDTTTAEVAFVVRDDYQHQGLARQLLATLAGAAWVRGITQFSAVTFFSNRGMMAVFRHSGYPITTSISYNEIDIHFSIDPSCKREVPSK